ncbi:MAG: glycosyltransferase 87 family protein [Actinomycetota bacterium]
MPTNCQTGYGDVVGRPVEQSELELVSLPRGSGRARAWNDALTSELGYLCMICVTVFLYVVIALLSLAPDGTIGKLSPIHETVQRNTYLAELLDVTGINHASQLQLVAVSIVVLALLLATYAWAVLIFRRRQDKGLLSILTLTFFLCLLLVVIPPLVSKDVFSNIFYGKIAARYHDNPYVLTPQRFAGDQLMVYVSLNWKNTAIVYGPVHTYFSMLLNLVAGEGITANIIVFKGAMAVFHFANILLVWFILGLIAPRRQRFGTMLYAWNPIALTIGVGGGHNDVMMMTLVLLAVYLLLKEKRWAGFVCLCLSVLVKYISVILVVALVIHLVSAQKGRAERLRALALYAAVFLLIFVLFFLPFWAGPGTFDSTLRNLQLNNYDSLGGWLSALFTFIFQYVLRIPASVAQTLGSVLSKLLLLPVFLAALWFAPRRMRALRDVPDCFFWVTLAYLVTTSYYMPWYFLWLLPFISLRPWDRASQWSLAVGTATIPLGTDIHPF